MSFVKKRSKKSLVPKLSLAAGASLLLSIGSLQATLPYVYPSGETVITTGTSFGNETAYITGGTLTISSGTLTSASVEVEEGLFKVSDSGYASLDYLNNQDNVLITGTSTISSTGTVTISGSLSGSGAVLMINDRAFLSAVSGLVLGGTNGTGSLVIGNISGENALTSGSLFTVGGITSGSGSEGSVVFNHTDTSLSFASSMTGTGLDVYAESGGTRLHGVNNIRALYVDGGGINVIGTAASTTTNMTKVTTGTLSITSGATYTSSETTTYQIGHISITQGSVASLGHSLIGGHLVAEGGAQLTTGVTNIGDAYSTGHVSISGTGTVWNLGGTTKVGIYYDDDAGQNTLSRGEVVLSEGAHLQAGDPSSLMAIVFDSSSSDASRLVIGGSSNTPTAAGTIQAFALAGGTIGGGGALVFNHTSGTTVENPEAYVFDTRITGRFSVMNAAGHTVIRGAHDYTGENIIYAGSLTIDGSITAETGMLSGRFVVNGTSGGITAGGGEAVINGVVNGDVTTALFAQVSGTGTIYGNLNNGGFVNPGNSPGTLTVVGNYEQTENGTLVIEINGNQHDKLVVSGTAFLGGKLLISTSLRNDSKVEILTADGGIVGTFDTVDTGLITYSVEYLQNSVVVESDVTTLTEFAKMRGLTPNELSVAKNLDKAARRGKLPNLLGQLYAMSVDDVETALTLLSPEQISQIFQIGFSGAQTQFTNLERRLSDVRDGAVGFSTNGLALSNSRGSVNYDGLPIMNERNGLTLAGWDGKSVVGKQATAPIIEQSRWSFFATGSGEWADVETTSIAQGSEFTSGGVTVGADYRVSDNFVVGIAGGYSNTQSDLANGGKIDVNSGRGSLYASVFGDGFYANTVVGGAYNSYETKRGTLGGKADGDTDGGEFDALIGGGYDYRIGGFSVGPVASLQYTYLGLSSFQETGSSAPQQFSSQNQDSLKSGLGLRASYAWNVGGLVIKPEVRAQWQHEFLDSTASLESSFVGGAGVFTVNGPNIGRDSLLLDAGLAVQINPAVSVFAYYTSEIGRTNYSSNAVNGGFRISF